jgi:cation transporter-like permease
MKPKVQKTRRNDMVWPISIILGGFWVVGLVTGHTLGGYIHLLPAVAVLLVLYRLSQGPRLA